jgi:intracellular multiplication protein IcmO
MIESGRSLYVKEAGRVRHSFMMGKSGSGKTVAILNEIRQQAKRGGGVFFVDPKPEEETYRTIQAICHAYGRPYDFRCLDITNPNRSHSVNFMMEGGTNEVTSHLSAIFSGEGQVNSNAEHFKSMMLTPAENRIAAIKELGLAFNAMDLFILLSNSNATSWLIRQLPDGEAKQALELERDGYVTTKTTRDGVVAEINQARWQSQVMGGANRIFKYGTGSLGKIMNTYAPDWTIDDAVDNNRITYVPLPILDMPEQAKAFSKMLLSALPETAELVEKMRGANIAGLFAFQTHANLLEIGDAFAARLIGNCEMRYAFPLGDPDSCEFMAKLFGEKLKVFDSRSAQSAQSSSNTNLDFTLFGRTSASNSAGSSEGEQYDYAVRPELFQQLAVGEAIVVPMASNTAFRINIPMVKPPIYEGLELPKVFKKPARGIHLAEMFSEHFQMMH